MQRKRELHPQLAPIFRVMGVPEELLVIPILESSYLNFSEEESLGGSAGLWQFQAATARRFGLRVDETVDERLDLLKSTQAAASYFQYLHSKFGDWHSVIAAYQIGEGALEARLRRSRGDGGVWSLVRKGALPDYLPQVMARVMLAQGGAYFPLATRSEPGSRKRGTSLGIAVDPPRIGRKPAILSEPLDLEVAK